MSYKEIINNIRKREIPLQEMIVVTWRCNLKCDYCRPFLPRGRQPLFSKIKKQIDKLAKDGNMQLFINGGEPLIRKDFLKIVRYAGQKPLAVVIQTNGTLITPKIAKKLKSFNVMEITLNLLAAEAKLHDGITGVKGSFKKTLAAVRVLKKENIRVVFDTVVVKKNQHQVEKIKKLAKTLKIPQRFRPVGYPDTDKMIIDRATYLNAYKADKPTAFYRGEKIA